MSKVIVTGGSGFIGTNLVGYLRNAGHRVTNLDVKAPGSAEAGGEFVLSNILDRSLLIEAVQRIDPDYLFHLAARTDLEGKTEEDYAANIDGVRNIVAAAASARSLKKAFFTSSMYVCKTGYIPQREDEYCPHTAYGLSKVEGERIVRSEAGDRFCWTLLRPTSIWGPWFGVPYITFFETVRKGLYFHPKGRRILRSYGFVLNAVHQLSQLMAGDNADRIHGKVLYLADYEPTDTLKWAQLIADRFDAHRIFEAPESLLKPCAKAGDVLKACGVKYPPLFTSRLNNLLTNAVFDMSNLRNLCGEQPYSLEQGVDLTVDWMQKHVLASHTQRYAAGVSKVRTPGNA